MVTIPFDTDWKDIGSWDAIYEVSQKDENGNCFVGKTVDIDSKNTMVYSTSKLVATLGLENNIVVETEDAILVSDKNNIFSLLIFNLSALNFICSADSSPDTYKILPSTLTL